MDEPQEAQVMEAVRQMQQMRDRTAQTQIPPALPPPAAQEPPSGLLQFLHLDSDALLILPLLLLLMREGADDKLVLALLYVLL